MGTRTKKSQLTGRRATIADVAALAGVSSATVSYVLNGIVKHTLSEATRDAVLKAAAELGYTPNQSARSLARGASPVVVCQVPALPLSETVLALLGELTDAFADRGHVMTVHVGPLQSRRLGILAKSLRPRAVFPLFPSLSDGKIDAEFRIFGFDYVNAEGSDPGAVLQVDHLFGNGHRQLAFAASSEAELATQSELRRQTVIRRAEALGLPPVPTCAIGNDPMAAVHVLKEWYAQGITAVCANNDLVGSFVIKAIKGAGLRCPDDISVIGYDAGVIASLSEPSLTSIAWQQSAAATVIADAIVNDGSARTTVISDVLVNVQLHEGGSVLCKSSQTTAAPV